MAIEITENAAEQVRAQLASRGHGEGIRVAVKTTGCSGYAYEMEFVDEAGDDDQVFQREDVKLFVDPGSLELLDGTELDFIRDGLNEGFEFRNPNVKAMCGCGESFTA